MISEKIRNYEVAKKRPHSDMAKIPENISSLPIFGGPKTSENTADDDAAIYSTDSSGESDEPGRRDMAEEDDMIRVKETGEKKRICLAATVDVPCGILPEGKHLHDFHAPPSKINARNIEALYWQRFGETIAAVYQREENDVEPVIVSNNSWNINSGDAVHAAEQQKNSSKPLTDSN